ncbi:MAG: hypothetical protein WCO35_00245 [Candidatus Nomurabacteria bacterium]
MKSLFVSLFCIFSLFSCKTKIVLPENFSDSVKVVKIVNHLDSLTLVSHLNIDMGYWYHSQRIIYINDLSFLEMSLIQSDNNYHIGDNFSWGFTVSRIWVYQGKCYITTFADGDKNGIPDCIIENEYVNFKYKPNKNLLDYFNTYDSIKEVMPVIKFKDLSTGKQKTYQYEYSEILETIKEKQDSIKKAKWQKD